MKPSVYNFVTPSFSDNRYIAYNSFSGAYIELDDARLAEMEQLMQGAADLDLNAPDLTHFQRNLVDQGFVVEEGYNEAKEIQDRYFAPLSKQDGMSLTIAPTISCNFGCAYCFQSHSNRRMGKTEMDRLVAFVDTQLVENTYLSITWFGGEPMTAFAVVEELAQRLADLAARKSCTFYHAIITNGYLLTEERAKFLASIPEFESAQVTLDGLADQHDQRRPTLAGKGTFDRIIQNIIQATQHITITVRINVDKSNLLQINDLLELLQKAGVQDQVYVYLGHVWDYTPEVEDSPFLTIEEFAEVDAQFKLTKFSMGFASGVRLPAPRGGAQCIADHPNGYVVGPSGLLFNCWNEVHEDESKASGVLPELDSAGGCASGACGSQKMQNNAAGWANYDPFAHQPCKTCKVAPLCMSGCPWESNKTNSDKPGFCTALRYNLGDELRLYEMQRRMKAAAGARVENSKAGAPALTAF